MVRSTAPTIRWIARSPSVHEARVTTTDGPSTVRRHRIKRGTAMDPQPNITQGFIEHTVKWALALPVQIRHDIIVSARDQAHLNRQAQRGERRGDHFGDPEVWDEIAGRIENEGHTPAD